jgi:hypothetical protein
MVLMRCALFLFWAADVAGGDERGGGGDDGLGCGPGYLVEPFFLFGGGEWPHDVEFMGIPKSPDAVHRIRSAPLTVPFARMNVQDLFQLR